MARIMARFYGANNGAIFFASNTRIRVNDLQGNR
jgi:hypothetical protein